MTYMRIKSIIDGRKEKFKSKSEGIAQVLI